MPAPSEFRKPSRARKARGAATQRIVADYLAVNGFPHATDAGAGRVGRDILGTPGLAIEVKARREYSPLAWLRQATAAAGKDLPLVVHRPDGMGPAAIAHWPVTLRLADAIALLRAAGYGEPPRTRADLQAELRYVQETEADDLLRPTS